MERDQLADVVAKEMGSTATARLVGRSWLLKHCGRRRLKYAVIVCQSHVNSGVEVATFYVCANDECDAYWRPYRGD